MKIRTTSPTASNLFYKHTSRGGKNDSLMINNSTGSVLPNCVGYARGRTMEVTGSCKIRSVNAKYFWLMNWGYDRDQTAKAGSIAVWNGNYGHVAFVEKVISSDCIEVSQSNYGGAVFEYKRIYKKNGKWVSPAGNSNFLGFVHVFNEDIKKSVEELAHEVLQGKWGNGAVRKNRLTAAGYDYNAVQSMVNTLWNKGVRS